VTVSKLREAMLAMPTPPETRNRASDTGPTLAVDNRTGTAELTFNTANLDLDGEALRHLAEEGLIPEEWAIQGVRTSRWTMANGEEGRSARYVFERKGSGNAYPIDEVLTWLDGWATPPADTGLNFGGSAFLALTGDQQFGKIDGDGVDGTLSRSVQYAHEMADEFVKTFNREPIDSVTIGFMGDHGEGFVSQGGANLWRTALTNTEQQRMTRRVMSLTLEVFSQVVPVTIPINMVAVPGNHGDTIRVAGKGTMKYHDSYDTEALISLADAVSMATEGGNRPELERVKFYVPNDDEIGVVLDLAGTRTAFLHGHFHRPGQHFKWLEGQTFDKTSPYRDVDLLIEGHLHHFFADSRSGVTFIGVPAVESESTWFRHRTGITGDPGCVCVTTRNGETSGLKVIR
jgi:hypothetical protein